MSITSSPKLVVNDNPVALNKNEIPAISDPIEDVIAVPVTATSALA